MIRRLFRFYIRFWMWWYRGRPLSPQARAWADQAVADLEALSPEMRTRPGKSFAEFKTEARRRGIVP